MSTVSKLVLFSFCVRYRLVFIFCGWMEKVSKIHFSHASDDCQAKIRSIVRFIYLLGVLLITRSCR